MKVLAILAVVSLLAVLPVGRSDAGPDGCIVQDPVPGVPVVLVHGWRSSARAMAPTADRLREQLGADYSILRFDYSQAANQWPSGATAGCLARYIVSAWKRTGEARKVVVVTHSMGGIAARFAAGQTVSGLPVADALAGLVTLATPHRGSPWGNTGAADFLERHLPGALPAGGDSAAACLAEPARRPPYCAPPPYLPAGPSVAEIGTQITIKRTLFNLGFIKKDAEITLWGDGIVPQDSANGYLGSGPDSNPPRGRVTIRTIPCQYSTDYLMSQKFGSKVGGVIGAEVATLANVLLDDGALDDLDKRRASLRLAELSVYASLTPCFHTPAIPVLNRGVPTEERVIAVAADAVREARNSGPATRTEVLRPVTAPGTPAAGWRVGDVGGLPVDCGYPSPASVSDGVHTCGPTVAAADVCWPEPGAGSVLCLRDPWEMIVYRNPAAKATVPVAATADPSPLGLELVDGGRCRLRNGGSWPGRPENDDLYGAYQCTGGNAGIIWAERGHPEIDKSSPTWTVLAASETSPLRRIGVKTAYFVGTG